MRDVLPSLVSSAFRFMSGAPPLRGVELDTIRLVISWRYENIESAIETFFCAFLHCATVLFCVLESRFFF
jgi:hypothetical protein